MPFLDSCHAFLCIEALDASQILHNVSPQQLSTKIYAIFVTRLIVKIKLRHVVYVRQEFCNSSTMLGSPYE